MNLTWSSALSFPFGLVSVGSPCVEGNLECGTAFSLKECYLVDPASSHRLVSKIKPCMLVPENALVVLDEMPLAVAAPVDALEMPVVGAALEDAQAVPDVGAVLENAPVV
ncbi:hypothetical protein ACET3Z_005294 [Daucus carota]